MKWTGQLGHRLEYLFYKGRTTEMICFENAHFSRLLSFPTDVGLYSSTLTEGEGLHKKARVQALFYRLTAPKNTNQLTRRMTVRVHALLIKQ